MIIIPKHTDVSWCLVVYYKWPNEQSQTQDDVTQQEMWEKTRSITSWVEHNKHTRWDFGFVFKFRDFWDKSLLPIIIFNKHKSF